MTGNDDNNKIYFKDVSSSKRAKTIWLPHSLHSAVDCCDLQVCILYCIISAISFYYKIMVVAFRWSTLKFIREKKLVPVKFKVFNL